MEQSKHWDLHLAIISQDNDDEATVPSESDRIQRIMIYG